jgi:hypothetical protein
MDSAPNRQRTRRPSTPSGAIATALLAGALLCARTASAQTIFGSLSNFDVFNDTGQETHGFEIELDGISSADVSYVFGAPYERYGDPVKVDFPGGVYVRYESPYDPATQSFTQATPLPPSPITPTAGHACWTGGSGNYLTAGCEHFGLGLSVNPTATVYRWLVADPAHPGSLIPSGTKVSIPAPVWNAAPNPVVGQPPIVQAVLPPPPPEIESQYGDAQWVKVFVTEAPAPAELHHLLTDDPAVPQDAAETEMEWVLLQAAPAGVGNDELINEGAAGPGAESVTRRYEFYKYTGAYDPESHEALCADGSCNAPAPNEIGDYIGAQMAAANLVPAAQTTLTVVKAGNGSGSVTSSPAGIDCGPTCAAPFDVDSSVTLSETPDADSFFGGFGGACAGDGPTDDVTITDATSCTATFHLLSESADLGVVLKQTTKTAKAGHRVSYAALVANKGPALASATKVEVRFLNLQPGDEATLKAPRKCSINGAVVTCPLGEIKHNPKAARDKTVRANVSVKPSAAVTIDVQAAASSATPSADPSGASAEISTTVVP